MRGRRSAWVSENRNVFSFRIRPPLHRLPFWSVISLLLHMYNFDVLYDVLSTLLISHLLATVQACLHSYGQQVYMSLCGRCAVDAHLK